MVAQSMISSSLVDLTITMSTQNSTIQTWEDALNIGARAEDLAMVSTASDDIRSVIDVFPSEGSIMVSTATPSSESFTTITEAFIGPPITSETDGK